MCVNPQYLLYLTYFTSMTTLDPSTSWQVTQFFVLLLLLSSIPLFIYVRHLFFWIGGYWFQCCAGFCLPLVWISCKYAYILPLEPPPPCAFTEHQADLPAWHSSFPPAVCCSCGSLSMSLFFQFTLPPFRCCGYTSTSLCAQFTPLQVGSSVIMFRFQINVKSDICFSLPDLLLFMTYTGFI